MLHDCSFVLLHRHKVFAHNFLPFGSQHKVEECLDIACGLQGNERQGPFERIRAGLYSLFDRFSAVNVQHLHARNGVAVLAPKTL